ncbi:MAG: hypothetical protein Kow00107_00920 [Planctomycetota bacterium]
MIKGEGGEISTVEHFLAAVSILGLTSLSCELDGPEMPACDGSAADFVSMLDSAGIVESEHWADPFRPSSPIVVEDGDAIIRLSPADGLRISYFLDLSQAGLPDEEVDYRITEDVFRRTICRARTFVPAVLAPKLLAQGYGKGATAENTLLLGDPDSIPRFENEAATHKVLDIIGDLAALGVPICGHIAASRSGHSQNARLASLILAEMDRRTTA